MPYLQRLVVFTVLGVACFTARANQVADPWAHLPYQLGQGLNFPEQGLDVGGYLSLQYVDLKQVEPVFSVHDLSLFVNKRFGTRWNLFTEMEIGDSLSVTDEGQVSHNPEFDVERLYADYRVSPAVTLRFGKFLTPVGRWNLIHADPLVWTVSRPLTTTAAFARHASGAMIYGTVPAAGHDFDYWAFVDDTAQLDPHQRNETAFDTPGSTITVTNSFNHAAGGRFLYHVSEDHVSVGASYVYYEMDNPREDKNLFGLDFYWNSHFVELSGEAVYRFTSNWNDYDERGGFIQAVVPVPHHFYLIGRHERYSATVLSANPTINTFCITYRPRPPVSFKLEYRSGSNNDLVAPDGWLGSLTVLF
jgi:hypothetical protein